jgi:hypothetical protein
MKLKAIAAALALLAGGQAYAAPISDDGMGVGGAGVLSGTGAGNWFLTVLDTVRNQGFVLNLGRNVLNDVTSPTNWSITNTALTGWLAGGTASNMLWNVSGLSNTDDDFAAPFPNIGYLTTNNNAARTNFNGDGFDNTLGMSSNVGNYLAQVNGDLGSSDSAIFVPADGFAYPGNPTVWGGTLGGGLPYDNRTTIGNSQFVNYVFNLGEPGGGPTPESTKLLGSIEVLANGQVNFTATAVPVPAAVWLLGSALLGMVGVSRRRRS